MSQQQRRSKTPTSRQGARDRSLDQDIRKPQARRTQNDSIRAQNQKEDRQQPRSSRVKASESSMYKENDPAKIEVITDGVKFYDTADRFMQIEKDYRFIKVHEEDCKVDPSILVLDYSLAMKGPSEDDSFANEPHLWLNFRRGNTVLELYDQADYTRLQKRVIARKGLTKFFDVSLNYVGAEQRYSEDILDLFEQNVKNLTLAPIRRALAEGHKVEVLRMLKANGENCQISWNPDAEAWVIASKNVALIARDERDLDLYKKGLRYSFASLMARCWFTQISKFSRKQLESLKSDFANRTFIGEYIGNVECQHLVKYPRETIIFYAIVENNSKKICMVTEEAYKIFKKHGLEVVDLRTIGVYSDYDELCDDLVNEYKVTHSRTIREDEEGAVVYFIKRDMVDAQRDLVLSLVKFKTLEYRLFRKMREKLRNYIDGKTNANGDQLIERYIKESKELCRGSDLPHPLEFYIDLCITAFNCITKGKKAERDYFIDLLLNEYIHFLEEVIFVHEERNRGNRKKYTGHVSFDSIVLDKQSSINYHGYLGPRQKVVPKQNAPIYKPVQEKPQVKQDEPKEVAQPVKQEVPKTQQIKKGTLGNNIIVLAPPCSLTKKTIQKMKQDFPQTFLEVQEFTRNILEPRYDGMQHQINLTLLKSLDGIVDRAESHTEKIYYLVYKFDKESLEKDCLQNFDNKEFHRPESIQNSDELQDWLEGELELLDDAMSTLKEKSNVSTQIKNEQELLNKINWAVSRLCPQIKKLQAKEDTSRKIQLVETTPAPVLKKSTDQKTEEEKIKKKVKINDVPIYQPEQPKSQSLYIKKQPLIDSQSSSRQETPQSVLLESRKKNSLSSDAQPSPNTVLQVLTQKTGSKKEKSIVVILPMGIPGMGKTTFIENQMRKFFEDIPSTYFTIISNDKIRRTLIDKFMEDHPGRTVRDSFESTYQQTGKLFNDTLINTIQKAVEDSRYDSYVICLDKNHPPLVIQRTVETIDRAIKQNKNSNVKIMKIAMIPEQVSAYLDYPFSMNFLVQCYQRCLDREQHETLSNEDPNHLARVQMFFYKSYQGIRFDRQFLRNYMLDEFIRVPLTFENKDLELPNNLRESLEKCLRLVQNEVPAPHKEFDRFVYLSQLNKNFYKGVSGKEDTLDTIMEREFSNLLNKDISPSLMRKDSHLSKSSASDSIRKVSSIMFIDEQLKEVKQASISSHNQSAQKLYQVKQQQATPKTSVLSDTKSTENGTSSVNRFDETEEVKHQDSVAFIKTSTDGPLIARQETSQANQMEPTPKFGKADSSKDVKPKLSQTNATAFDQTFETSTKNHRKIVAKSSKIPIYQGISLHNDPKLDHKLKALLLEGLLPMVNNFKGQVIQQTYDSIKQLFESKKKEIDGWRRPDDYHVTTYFVGKDEERTTKKIYQDFEEDLQVPVLINAILVVPNKIITGICFPDHPVDNKCPHVTLLINEWQPKMSNDALQACCVFSGVKGAKDFKSQYEQLRTSGRVDSEEEVFQANVKIVKTEPGYSCYLIALREPVLFEGVTKNYY